MTVVGHGHPRDEFMSELSFMDVLLGRKLTGCVMGGVTLRRDIPKYMEMYRTGQINIDALLTNKFRLSDIQAALDDSERGALKNIVVCDESYYDRCKGNAK